MLIDVSQRTSPLPRLPHIRSRGPRREPTG